MSCADTLGRAAPLRASCAFLSHLWLAAWLSRLRARLATGLVIAPAEAAASRTGGAICSLDINGCSIAGSPAVPAGVPGLAIVLRRAADPIAIYGAGARAATTIPLTTWRRAARATRWRPPPSSRKGSAARCVRHATPRLTVLCCIITHIARRPSTTRTVPVALRFTAAGSSLLPPNIDQKSQGATARAAFLSEHQDAKKAQAGQRHTEKSSEQTPLHGSPSLNVHM